MNLESAKIVPKLLNFEQKERYMDIAKEMLMTLNGDTGLLKKVNIVNILNVLLHLISIFTRNLIQVLWSIFANRKKSETTPKHD